MGDPACWLPHVCLECGRFTEDLEEHAECPHCGAAIAADPAASGSPPTDRHGQA